ncbi:MAG: recombination mediator RecR [Paracoccaceae bacterium]|nr:recombination mediator RecR [Paracoccaceae bacterium]MDE2918099.1 recombination mediator RecR [Paracoccaceae bacterium]MYE37091.1 recombination protein RecR [Paracoccaceae bacterium]
MARKNEIQLLVDQFARLPGLGPKSSKRIVLHLIKNRTQLLEPMVKMLENFTEIIDHCQICGNVTLHSKCDICSDENRQKNVICVVESVIDLWALEKTEIYRGQYHVLGGVLSIFEGIGPEELGIPQLINRIKNEAISEVILAMNATVPGQSTTHFIVEQLEGLNIKITTLGRGIPSGGELDYLDSTTITSALNSRQEY